MEEKQSRVFRLKELAALFLRLGFTAFGGPAAHLALLEDEVVQRRRWTTHEHFLDLIGVTNLIPGPNSTELVIHIGNIRGGLAGMIVAGLSFMLPAATIVGFFAYVYVHYGSLPQAEGMLYGVKPVVLAVIFRALWTLGRNALKTRALAALATAGAMASFLGANELLVLVVAGGVAAIRFAAFDDWRKHTRGLLAMGVVLTLLVVAVLMAPLWTVAGQRPFSVAALFLFFLKVGSVLYGSGYVLLAFIQGDLVDRWHWITQSQLLDAVAVGQVTPGPLFTAATFIGFVLAGFTGAVAATIGIFLPSFVFVACSGPLIPRLRSSPMAGAFLDGVNAASLALMAVVTVTLAAGSVTGPTTALLAVASAVLLFRYGINSTWLILGGALLGLATALI